MTDKHVLNLTYLDIYNFICTRYYVILLQMRKVFKFFGDSNMLISVAGFGGFDGLKKEITEDIVFGLLSLTMAVYDEANGEDPWYRFFDSFQLKSQGGDNSLQIIQNIVKMFESKNKISKPFFKSLVKICFFGQVKDDGQVAKNVVETVLFIDGDDNKDFDSDFCNLVKEPSQVLLDVLVQVVTEKQAKPLEFVVNPEHVYSLLKYIFRFESKVVSAGWEVKSILENLSVSSGVKEDVREQVSSYD